MVILLLFGCKPIPELARGLGSGVREFKKGAKGESDPERHGASEKRGESDQR